MEPAPRQMMMDTFTNEPLTHVIIAQQAVSAHFYMMVRELAFGCAVGLLLFVLFFSREIIIHLRPYFLYIKLFVQIVRRDPAVVTRTDSPMFWISSGSPNNNNSPPLKPVPSPLTSMSSSGIAENNNSNVSRLHVPPQKIVLDKNFQARLSIANLVRNLMIAYIVSFLIAYNFFGTALHVHLFPHDAAVFSTTG